MNNFRIVGVSSCYELSCYYIMEIREQVIFLIIYIYIYIYTYIHTNYEWLLYQCHTYINKSYDSFDSSVMKELRDAY